MAIEVRIKDLNITFPALCVCCLGPIDKKRVQIIDESKIDQTLQVFPAIAVPCCPQCRDHCAIHMRKKREFETALLYSFACIVIIPLTAYFTSRILLSVTVIPLLALLLWFFRAGPGLDMRGRWMMKPTCCALEPAVTFNTTTITFLNPEYVQRFLTENPSNASI